MADPRASIREARSLGLAPPPAVSSPVLEPVADVPVDAPHEVDEPTEASKVKPKPSRKGSGPKKPSTVRPTSKDDSSATVESAQSEPRPGRVRRIVYLPQSVRHRLREEAGGSTKGAVIMEALRANYEWLQETYGPAPSEQVGPFPAPQRVRRRASVEEPAPENFAVSTDEDSAIDDFAEACDLNRSELITLALERHFDTSRLSPSKS